jgi:2-methylcitrate dehydratase PrpD
MAGVAPLVSLNSAQRDTRLLDSQNAQPQRGNVEGVLACPASCVENRAGERAFARQAHYRWLWLSGLPGRRAVEIRSIPRVRGLGTDWELPCVVFKPYPCNHFTHAGVDAALRLRAQGLAPADVTAIELGVAKPVPRTIAEPPEAKARPASGYHAAFSGPYTVAAALLGGGLGVSHEDSTDAAARDPRRLALAALVRWVEDERCSASFPHTFPAVLRVTTRTGEELEARVEVNRGGPGNPLSNEELARISPRC